MNEIAYFNVRWKTSLVATRQKQETKTDEQNLLQNGNSGDYRNCTKVTDHFAQSSSGSVCAFLASFTLLLLPVSGE